MASHVEDPVMAATNKLDETFAALLARRQTRRVRRRLTVVPPGTADFSSNAYLSLSTNPAVHAAYLRLLQTAAAPTTSSRPSLTGSGASRLLDGNQPLHLQLEADLAAFHRAPAGLLFNSGLDANTGLFSCVPQRGDVVVFDALIHASVHDGMRLSRAANTRPFAHNCVEGDGGLRQVLQQLLDGGPLGGDKTAGDEFKSGQRNIFVAVEGVYSMDGDVAPLKEVVECVEEMLPAGNGYIVVDEAHSTGIFGENGRGLVSELGLEKRVWARLHTFGKAMGCSGAIVLCSPITRDYLINYARSLIYTTSMGFTSLAAIKVTYDFLMSGQADPLSAKLRHLARLTHEKLQALCAEYPDLLRVNPDVARTPIIPLFTATPHPVAFFCQSQGYMVRPIVPPTVPAGQERVRICLHADNTEEEIEGLVQAVRTWAGKQRETGPRL